MSAMGSYEKDEYEDLDEYEEDSDEQEYEEGGENAYEEEEIHQPTQDELEYLELRQRLKETIRKKMKKELGTASSGSGDKVNSVRMDNYGSFFGPSQPVIAQRVIQESKSLLENPTLAARISRPNNNNHENLVSIPIGSKPRANLPIAVSGVKKKAEILKNTRDYSFLLSEDAEVPGPSKNLAPRNAFASKSDARPTQILPRIKRVVNEHGRDAVNGRDGRNKVIANNQARPKVGLEKTASSKLLMESRKQPGSNNAGGPGRPVGLKGVPSRNPMTATGTKVTHPVARNSTAGARKPLVSQHQPVGRKPDTSRFQSGVQRPTHSNLHASHSKTSPAFRKTSQETRKPNDMPKRSLSTSRDEVKRLPPKITGRGVLGDQRHKSKPGKRRFGDSDDEDDAISIIRKMSGYNPNKYHDDGDDSDMEANFDEIMKEEKRSLRIARKEDEEQARLLEEEERRKKMRLSKKQKMNH